MVINNKLEGNSELVGIKSSEKSSDIDALFAELFALVNLDSIDSEKNSFQELDAKEIDDKLNITDSNKNTMNVARSLAEVFYKELGFSKSEIAIYSKGLGWITTVIFTLLGGIMAISAGTIKTMFFAGTLMALTNLIFGIFN